jgi:hypothetical protein
LPPRGVWDRSKVWQKKLGTVYVYPCPNMLVVVYCGIPKVGVEPSIVDQLWKWFTGWADVFGIVVLSVDVTLVCGLV